MPFYMYMCTCNTALWMQEHQHATSVCVQCRPTCTIYLQVKSVLALRVLSTHRVSVEEVGHVIELLLNAYSRYTGPAFIGTAVKSRAITFDTDISEVSRASGWCCNRFDYMYMYYSSIASSALASVTSGIEFDKWKNILCSQHMLMC